MLNARTDVGESGLGSLHTEQSGGALQAIEELAEHLVAAIPVKIYHQQRNESPRNYLCLTVLHKYTARCSIT
jgi:hypothetical protein